MKKFILAILMNPITLLLSVIIGIYIGVTHKTFGSHLSVYATVYLLLLNMAVIPVIISAIICSIGKFITNGYLKNFFGKIILFVSIVSIFYSFLGMVVGLIFSPGDLSKESKYALLHQKNLQSEVTEVDLFEESTSDIGVNFLLKFIPSNVFNSLSSNHIFSILIFSILIGLVIGSLSKKAQSRKYLIISFFEEVYEVFSILVSYLMIFLPVFLICIAASEIAKIGSDIMVIAGKLVIIFYISGILLLCINIIVLSINSKQRILSTVINSFYPMMASFFTKNSIVTMPIFIDVLSSRFKVNHLFSKTVLPVLVVIGRFGNILYFSLVTVFSVQLYDIELGIMIYVFLSIAVIIVGLVTFGMSGISTLSVLAVVISSVGIPIELTLLLLISIDIVIEPLRSTIIMHTNTTLTSVLYKIFVSKYKDIK